MKSYLCIIIFLPLILEAKTIVIKGKITNEANDPLPNVNIISFPSKIGTQSDQNGEFFFEILSNDKQLEFNHVAYHNLIVDAIIFDKDIVLVLKEKVIEIDSLNVIASDRNEFDKFNSKNIVIHLDLDQLQLKGFKDLGEMIFSEQTILLNESMALIIF